MRLPRQQVEGRVKEFAEMCRRQGIVATHQRTVVYRELASTDEHPSAEALYKRVRASIPAISLDTVYRTLRLLESKGAVTRVDAQADRARFDANTAKHHHFVCTGCGRVSDFCSGELDAFDPLLELSGLGKVISLNIEVRGVCRACEQQQKGERQ